MFKLTKQEQRVVALLASAILLGVAVREWRARHPQELTTVTLETKGH